MFTGGCFPNSQQAAIFDDTPRQEFHHKYLTSTPIYDSEQFEKRYDNWKLKELDIEGIKDKNLSKEDLQFKLSKRHPNLPVSHNICRTIQWPTVMHAWGHAGELIFLILLCLMDKKDDSYKTMYTGIETMHNYLANGNIVASTSELLDILHELSCI